MTDPISTYRIQFNKDFTFRHFADIIPYLQELGVKSIYASPVFEASPGSTHGYDGINPNQINPEIGTLAELRKLSATLRSHGMIWVQDIVPNHMAFHHHNPWLMDVLKFGEASEYRNYFDILSPDLEKEPLIAPFLGDSLDAVIERGELKVVQENGESMLHYFDSLWPLKEDTDLTQPMESIAKSQYYRLCSYQESNERMNYRRFFTVNSLICLNIQDQQTFEAYHQLTRRLVKEGVFQGLRIDHVDGLYDPLKYLQDLREHVGQDVYIIVEKILEPEETLPKTWPVQGTTGYDFLGLVNQVFVNQKAEKKFDKFYKNFGQYSTSVQTQIKQKKKDFLFAHMKGELDNLFNLFLSLDLLPSDGVELAEPEVFKRLISEVLVRCPVYRYYGNQYPLSDEEQQELKEIFDSIASEKELQQPAWLLQDLLFNQTEAPADYQRRILQFYQRLMQITGPLMAKGVEDTLMYTYNRFIGSNEVGDSPDVFGISIDDFHQAILTRYEDWPLAMNASSTHDTKRGEDARARLQVLTHLRNEWLQEVESWQEMNRSLKQADQPDTNDEYFIYQTLLATFPEQGADRDSYPERLEAYMQKALRESKRNSDWDAPNEAYEERTMTFIRSILQKEGSFWPNFERFYKKVCYYGKINSMAALLLKHGCPGIPDTYQGDEFWNLSMVDPDNRRPVDYAARAQFLKRLRKEKPQLEALWDHGAGGEIKLYILKQLLCWRKRLPALFAQGAYVPLETTGKHAGNLIAFARTYKEHMLVFAVPLNLAAVDDWGDTKVILPGTNAKEYHDIFRDLKFPVESSLNVEDIFADLPLALLHLQRDATKRGAGVLLPVFSLPSDYGIGDLGPGAHSFISFLAGAGQKYWQLLPLNPVDASQSFSPYSAESVMAGNTMFISPEMLVDDGLLKPADLEKWVLPSKRKVNYKKVAKRKAEMVETAFKAFKEGAAPELKDEFGAFCQQESFWLQNYALFVVISRQYEQPWYEWPEGLRLRDKTMLAELADKFSDELLYLKWGQFLFDRQWKKLRQAAQRSNIKLIGDLPFYAALNSADVWANPDFFSIDEAGKPMGLAGVPPDYFNAEGQLWGMPVYNWETLEKAGYRWWIDRLRKNMELVDLVRLDHFRAFSAYWEVPASSRTAKVGRWLAGPGEKLFKVIEAEFGKMPFIAEDLGEIDEPVYTLRDGFKLPGMKVLQFAFGDDSSDSIHIPHQYENENCIVYTGTHDNNTLLGWYKEEADKETRRRVKHYLGRKVDRNHITRAMIRLAYASIARVAIIPVQDLLNIGSEGRMNTPAKVEENWVWRLKAADTLELNSMTATLKDGVKIYGRL